MKARHQQSLRQVVLTAEATRAADDYTINEFGIAGFTLMELAGRGTAESIVRHFGSVAGRRINVYCGKGNNGGDGFVIARYLYDQGALIHVVALAGPEELSPDAEANYRLLQKCAAPDDDHRLNIISFSGAESLPMADVHVDALLGTGLTSDVREPILSLIRWLNDQPGYKVAVDMPTGLHTDLGRPLGAAFEADLTCTMAALKKGQLLHEGARIAGRVDVIDIGIPRFALEAALNEGQAGCAWLSTDADVRHWLPERSSDANKYSVGLALVVAGSAGMTGAPVMAATAAARIGSGYVVCACDHRIQSVLSTKMTEVTTIPLPASTSGIDPDGAMSALRDRLDKTAGGLIGCGLGRDPDTQTFIRRFLSDVDVPLVIDADGLNALAGATNLIQEHANGRWILTPHMGEFRRLTEDGIQNLQIDPHDTVSLAQHFARKWNCVLLLKGLPSVVAGPDGAAWINSTGGPALATAGTGDILAGFCAGLLAQGVEPVGAAVAALHLGGAAAESYARTRAGRSMQAMDLANEVSYVLKDRFGDA